MKIFCAILLMFCATLIWSSEPTPFMAKLIKIYQKDFEKLNTPAKESDFIAQLPKFFQCKNMKIKQNWTFYAPKGGSGTAPYFGGVIYHQTKGYHLISLRLNSLSCHSV